MFHNKFPEALPEVEGSRDEEGLIHRRGAMFDLFLGIIKVFQFPSQLKYEFMFFMWLTDKWGYRDFSLSSVSTINTCFNLNMWWINN